MSWCFWKSEGTDLLVFAIKLLVSLNEAFKSVQMNVFKSIEIDTSWLFCF